MGMNLLETDREILAKEYLGCFGCVPNFVAIRNHPEWAGDNLGDARAVCAEADDVEGITVYGLGSNPNDPYRAPYWTKIYKYNIVTKEWDEWPTNG